MVDCHVHIEKGPYAYQWINQFINQALMCNVDEIYFLEHSHRFYEFLPLYYNMANHNNYQYEWFKKRGKLSLNDYIRFIENVKRSAWPISLKFGLEICYEPGQETFINNICREFEWDYLTGSVHWVDGFAYDHQKDHWKGKNIDKLYMRYYEIMYQLIKSNLFTGLGHPDAIKCFGYTLEKKIDNIYLRIAQMLNSHNMYTEDSTGLRINYKYPEIGMNQRMRAILKKNHVKILPASDAHRPKDVGAFFKHLPLN